MAIKPRDVDELKEGDKNYLEQFKLPDQHLLTHAESRIGRPLTHTELVSKVRKLTRYSVWAEDSINWSNGVNFYTNRGKDKICLSTPFEKGFLPEYSIIHTDIAGLPGRRTVGWREVLSRLLRQKMFTYAQAEQAFGRPSDTPSTLWDRQTRQIR